MVFFESIGKVCGMVVASQIGDFLDLHIAFAKQFNRMFHPGRSQHFRRDMTELQTHAID